MKKHIGFKQTLGEYGGDWAMAKCNEEDLAVMWEVLEWLRGKAWEQFQGPCTFTEASVDKSPKFQPAPEAEACPETCLRQGAGVLRPGSRNEEAARALGLATSSQPGLASGSAGLIDPAWSQPF